MDLPHLLSKLTQAQLLSEPELKQLCEVCKALFFEEPNVVSVPYPVTICGDIHGQFYDLLELLRTGGHPPQTAYVFDGDFVDRGYHSIETISYLLVLKAMHPSTITLVRGNHESRQITQTYGFYDEIIRKYGHEGPWKLFMEVFDLLPLGALVQGRILVMHGGLSPDIKTIDHIRTIDRRMEIPYQGPFCDMMWSDPEELLTGDWELSSRGAGYLFGATVVKKFNHHNGLDLIARAHQLVQEGYKFCFDYQLVTVWSAPNYCNRSGNVAAILQIDEKLNKKFRIFTAALDSAHSVNPQFVLPYFL